jgi:hypothetical protein
LKDEPRVGAQRGDERGFEVEDGEIAGVQRGERSTSNAQRSTLNGRPPQSTAQL